MMRQWQSEALQTWANSGHRGIVAAATGTGKTRLALHAIREATDRNQRIIVVVPTRVLQDQWVRELRRFGLGRRLALIGGADPSPSPDAPVTVAVIDSARTGAKSLIRHWADAGLETFLIVDECHWAGSQANRALFDAPTTWALGLSATPERGDDGLDEVLVPSLGPVIYTYSLRQAMDDGVLSELQLVNLIVELSAFERGEYSALCRRVDAAEQELRRRRPDLFENEDWGGAVAAAGEGDALAKRLAGLIAERRRLLAKSAVRLAIFRSLVSGGLLTGRRTIVFNESIDQAKQVASLITEAGLRVVEDNSRIAKVDRQSAHERFRSGSAEALVAVRTVDEGVDVPDADQCVILSGTMNARQRIQRLGRVVRLGGLAPRAVSLLAAGTIEEQHIAGRDLELLGQARVRTVRVTREQLPSVTELFSK